MNTQKSPKTDKTNKIEKTSLFGKLPEESQKIIESFDEIVQRVKPLNSKQLYRMPETIKELSHLLTDERNNRRMGYMNDIPTLSAYIRYFTWWNLVRLTPLFAGFETNPQSKELFEKLPEEPVFLDLGSGPLTVPIALWLGCPSLRLKKLTFYCLDTSQNALALGEEILLSVMAKTYKATPEQVEWNIIRVKGEIGTEIRKKADFITCANMFNELYWNTSKPLEEVSKNYTNLLLSYGNEKTSVLVIEPGVPRSGRFITLLRNSLIRKKMSILSPCPHMVDCPMEGKKGGKWCHFTLLTDKAPRKLHKLSDSAKLTKDRASFSFVFASNIVEEEKLQDKELDIRVVSDPIRLPREKVGRYACSSLGLTLLEAPEKVLSSGDFVRVQHPKTYGKNQPQPRIDRKSNAVIFEL